MNEPYQVVYCPKCEQKCSWNDAVCINCGHRLAALRKPNPAPLVTVAKPIAKTVQQFRACPKCCESVHVRALKCPHCKSNIRTSPTTIVIASIFGLFCLFFCTGGFGMFDDIDVPSNTERWRELSRPVGSSSSDASRTRSPKDGNDWNRMSYSEKLDYCERSVKATNMNSTPQELMEALDAVYSP